MPWNGSGTYAPPGASFPEVNGTLIDATRFDATVTDLANGITASLAKNGENAATGNLPMGGFKHTGAAAAAAAGQYLIYGQALVGSVGAVGAPSFAILGNLNTGMWSPGTNILAWSINGAEAMRLNANGRLGIAVDPTTPLDVNGSITVRGNICASSTASAWSIAADPGATGGAVVSVYGSTHGTPNQIVFTSGGAARALVNNSGVMLQAGSIFGSSTLANFYFAPDIGNGNPGVQYDANDYIDFNRATNLMRMVVGNIVGFAVDSAGRVYGQAVHNNASSPTGTTNGYFASGTFTPTVTNVANAPASSGNPCRWVRVGNCVIYSGSIQSGLLTATSNTITTVRVSLPIASNLTALDDATGSLDPWTSVWSSCAVYADVAGDRLEINWVANGTNLDTKMGFTVIYEVK